MRHGIVQKKAKVLALIITLPHPHLSMLGYLALASSNSMTHINIELGEKESLFLLYQVKCVNFFSMIVDSPVLFKI